MRVAILGTRGVPASYGGFETFAEELSAELCKRGHQVTVYGRRGFGETYTGPFSHRGAEIRVVPTFRHKYLETPVHALVSFLDLFKREVDVVLLCNAANSPFSWLVRLRAVPLLINVDGIERKRTKWNMVGRLWYRLGEWCSVLFATKIVADARVIADYYLNTYQSQAEVIAYGANAVDAPPGEILNKFGLKARAYLLYVSRLEPENNALGVIEAYNSLQTEMPLVIVGDAPYARRYIEKLREAATDKVIFTGYQFGHAYRELRNNCYLYIQATEVGGTHPALVEAMAYGNCVIANDTPEHREVLEDCGVYYPYNNFSHLRALIKELVADKVRAKALGESAKKRADQRYRWQDIADRYEQLMNEVVA